MVPANGSGTRRWYWFVGYAIMPAIVAADERAVAVTETRPLMFHWFAVPELSRADLQNSARALWIVSWPFVAIITAVLGIAVLVEPSTLARRAVTIAIVGILTICLHTISRAGQRQMLASWMLVLGLSVIVTQRAWITGGINTPVAVFYALFIVMAGLLIGVRGSLVTAAVCFFGAIILTVGTALEWLPIRPGAGSPVSGWLFSVLAIGLALVLQVPMRLRLRRDGPNVGMRCRCWFTTCGLRCRFSSDISN